MAQRKAIPAKLRLKVLKRDNFKCKLCGRSPATDPELELEVDHILPVSKGGGDDFDNLQTLCILCNRGKGNDESLNLETEERIANLLDRINPEILKQIELNGNARVVANDTDYAELIRLSAIHEVYEIKMIPNTIIGYHACFNLGIYTINDNGAVKVNFFIGKQN